jgi:flagellar biosynthetic protein FliR
LNLLEADVFRVFVLVMVRVSGLLVAAPVLGSGNFPVMTKAGLSALIAILLTPVIPLQPEPLPDDFASYALMALGELAVGLLMGFVMNLAFAAIQVAGQVIDMLSGFALVNVFNPALETQVPIFGFFLFIMAALLLLATNGHHLMITHLVATFERIPLGGVVLRPALMREVSTWGRVLFVDGLIIAAPVAGSLFVAYIVMGMAGRVVPQIHLFVVGFPLTVAMSLLMGAFVIELYLATMEGVFGRMFDNVRVLIRGLS